MPRLTRIALVHGALVLFALALIVRAAQVQLLERAQWAARAERQHFASSTVPAPRGNIYDVRGTPLAMSREMTRLSVAPREVASPQALSKALSRLGVPRSAIARAMDTHRAWVPLPGSYLPTDVQEVVSMRGVYSEPVEERVYTERAATRRVVGRVDDRRGEPHGGGGGLELTLDSLLSGIDGRTTLARDSRGRKMDQAEEADVEPVAGASVTLTINQELQEISQRALAQAIERTRADGGDIVIIDPHDGGIRAMASERVGDRSFGSPVISEPFEPGSTVKPLFASALLERDLAKPTDSVETENGVYTIEGRTIRDEHPASELSLADVIKYSSNIGIVKFVSRMSEREEFETLRDFGFGTPTGIDALDGHRTVGIRSITTGAVRPLDFMVGGALQQRELPAIFSVPGPESYLAGLRLGLGIAQVPYFHVQNDLKTGMLVEILRDFPPQEIPVSLLYPRSRQLSLRLRVFLDWAAREFAARNPRRD